MNAPGSYWLPAHAKLNLGLRIVGRRADGYHLLDTVFHALALADDLHLSLRPEGGADELYVTADEPAFAVAAGPDNLVQKALRHFAAACGYRGAFKAALHKRIPHGGGLGGGSSDAAAALRLANHLLGTPVDPDALATLAVGLGADVPFFLRGDSQRGQGIGDQLSPAEVAARSFVLLVPPFGCPTADVYKSFAGQWQGLAAADTVRPIPVPDTSDAFLRNGFRNDLQPAAERVRPELGALRQRAQNLQWREVAMTGSGSTLFVPCADDSEARQCRDELAPLQNEGVRLLVTRSAGSGVEAPRPSDEAADRKQQ
jgi:4-diphosphocytidyl-2-C-methyl-D-erythritol kinase